MDKLFWLVLSYIVKEEQKFIQEQMLELEKMHIICKKVTGVKYERLGKNKKKVSVYEA